MHLKFVFQRWKLYKYCVIQIKAKMKSKTKKMVLQWKEQLLTMTVWPAREPFHFR